jgi:anaerobic selenocysteine-containing dehydrogenase
MSTSSDLSNDESDEVTVIVTDWSGGDRAQATFCRICEPLCGMIATVEDGRLLALRPDKDHPLSSGFACQKGIASTEVHNDPDRVTAPLRRGPHVRGLRRCAKRTPRTVCRCTDTHAGGD